MTAINVIRQAKAVHILSDGVFCNAEGVICELGPNVFSLPHLPAAIAIRGPTQFMPFLVHRLARECQSFDNLLAGIVPIALEVHISVPMTLGYGNVTPNFDLVVVGWSAKRNRAESFLVTSEHHVSENDHGAWRLVELPDVLITPPVGMAQIQFLKWKVPESAEAFRPDIDGIKLLEAQRLSQGSLSLKYPNEEFGFSVGGFIQLTSVCNRGVSSAILHRWPDKAGQKIAIGVDGCENPEKSAGGGMTG